MAHDLFSQFHAPDGTTTHSQAHELCANLEAFLHTYGWGQPATLHTVTDPDPHSTTTHAHPEDIVEINKVATDPDPTNVVWGHRLPPDALGALLTWEADGWLGRPQTAHTHPPTPTRYVSYVATGGRQLTIARAKGTDPIELPHDWYPGLTGIALRRVAAAPCPPAPLSVATWLGCTALRHAAPGLFALADADPAAARDGAAARLMTSAVALVCTLVLGSGTAHRDALAPGAPATALYEAANQLAELTWQDILTGGAAAALLPAVVNHNRAWCDANLLAWVSWANHAPQDTTIATLAAAGRVGLVREITGALASAGWIAPDLA